MFPTNDIRVGTNQFHNHFQIYTYLHKCLYKFPRISIIVLKFTINKLYGNEQSIQLPSLRKDVQLYNIRTQGHFEKLHSVLKGKRKLKDELKIGKELAG